MRIQCITIVILAITFCVLNTGCSENELQKISKALLVVSQSIGELQKNVELAFDQKLTDQDTTIRILEISKRMNASGDQITAVLESIDKLDPVNRQKLIDLLMPIIQALDPDQIAFIAGIKDESTRMKLSGAFVLIRTTLSSIMIILAAGGN